MENDFVDTNENWIKWDPCGIPSGEFIVTSLVEDLDGTRITLDDEETMSLLKVSWFLMRCTQVDQKQMRTSN